MASASTAMDFYQLKVQGDWGYTNIDVVHPL